MGGCRSFPATVIEDAIGFICAYQVMPEGKQDRDVVVPALRAAASPGLELLGQSCPQLQYLPQAVADQARIEPNPAILFSDRL